MELRDGTMKRYPYMKMLLALLFAFFFAAPGYGGEPFATVDLTGYRCLYDERNEDKMCTLEDVQRAQIGDFLDAIKDATAEQCDRLLSCEKLNETARKELMAYLIDKAWYAYVETGSIMYMPEQDTRKSLSQFSHEEREAITRNIVVSFYKSGELFSERYASRVPMMGEVVDGRIHLHIACDAFGKRFDPDERVARIAHEVLGHGLLRRDYGHVLAAVDVSNEKVVKPATDEMRAKGVWPLEEGMCLFVETGTYAALRHECFPVGAYFRRFYVREKNKGLYADGVVAVNGANKNSYSYPRFVDYSDGSVYWDADVLREAFSGQEGKILPERVRELILSDVKPSASVEIKKDEYLSVESERRRDGYYVLTPRELLEKLSALPLDRRDDCFFENDHDEEFKHIGYKHISDEELALLFTTLLDDAWKMYWEASPRLQHCVEDAEGLVGRVGIFLTRNWKVNRVRYNMEKFATRNVLVRLYQCKRLFSQDKSKAGKDGKSLGVPLQGGYYQNRIVLQVAVDFLAKHKEKAKGWTYETMLAKLAHEVFGHGLIRKTFYNDIMEINNQIERRKNDPDMILEEGLCVVIEAMVYTHCMNGGVGITKKDITDYVQKYYVDGKSSAASAKYVQGVRTVLDDKKLIVENNSLIDLNYAAVGQAFHEHKDLKLCPENPAQAPQGVSASGAGNVCEKPDAE